MNLQYRYRRQQGRASLFEAWSTCLRSRELWHSWQWNRCRGYLLVPSESGQGNFHSRWTRMPFQVMTECKLRYHQRQWAWYKWPASNQSNRHSSIQWLCSHKYHCTRGYNRQCWFSLCIFVAARYSWYIPECLDKSNQCLCWYWWLSRWIQLSNRSEPASCTW